MGFQRINKKGLQFRNAFFAIIVLGLVVVSLGIIVQGWSNHYSSNISWNLGGFDSSSSIYETAGIYVNATNPSSPDVGSDYSSNIYKQSFGVITNLINPFAMVFGENGMLYSIGNMFGIPSYIIIALITMIVLGLIFAFLAIIFKQGNRSTV